MALYHVRVRNYYWNRTLSKYSKDHRVHTPVQSPVRQQGNCAAPCTVRLLNKEERLGVHLVSHDKDLTVYDGRPPYLAEAHGIIIRTSRQSCPRPIWVVQEEIQFEPPFPVSIVDLATNESIKSECASICWVPHLKESNGTLLTILNDVPGEVQIGSTKTIRSNVVTQVPGCPEKTKAEWVEVERLSSCSILDDKEKETIFNAQLESLHSDQKTSVPPRVSLRECIRSPMERLRTSPFRVDTLVGLSANPGEDLGVLQAATSDRSIEDSTEDRIDDSSDLSDEGYLSEDPFEGPPLSTVESPLHRRTQPRDIGTYKTTSVLAARTTLSIASSWTFSRKCFLRNHEHCRLPLAEEVKIVDLDSVAASSTVSGSSSLALALEQSSMDTTSQHLGDDDVDGEDEYRSICGWPLVPNLETRLRSPDLSGLVGHDLDPSSFWEPDVASPYEAQSTTPSPSMMDIDGGWTLTDEEGMSLLQHGLPSTPPPSYGMYQ
ncbi:hypothetical protein PG994_007605 [Apiospora phragmitis]|uniref:Uncharacterized protein n=1 Tax=Apiospora phragmitis TaxID=2905665 RepID=A0ABR1UQP9_9PEZI